jgi:hypothetical protein
MTSLVSPAYSISPRLDHQVQRDNAIEFTLWTGVPDHPSFAGETEELPVMPLKNGIQEVNSISDSSWMLFNGMTEKTT